MRDNKLIQFSIPMKHVIPYVSWFTHQLFSSSKDPSGGYPINGFAAQLKLVEVTPKIHVSLDKRNPIIFLLQITHLSVSYSFYILHRPGMVDGRAVAPHQLARRAEDLGLMLRVIPGRLPFGLICRLRNLLLGNRKAAIC